MVDFAGWNMPVQYKSIVAEHQATRGRVGLFDVSHMGEFAVSGADAHDFIQHMIANDLNKLTKSDMALYTQFVREDGGTVDDLIVYRRKDDYLLVVNASNIEKDWNWLKENKQGFGSLELSDISEQMGLLALQGPRAVDLFASLAGSWVSDLKSFTAGEAVIDGVPVYFGRTGYTGEDGFEILVDADKTEALWQLLLEKGKSFEIEPCGLGARDTLRLEAGLPLYGHELTDTISPVQAGLGWSVKTEKGSFIGRDVLARQKSEGCTERIVCLKVEGRALPRQDYRVFEEELEVGIVTSGSQGIFVGYPIAFALVKKASSSPGKRLQVAIRSSKVEADVVKRPFYKRVD